MLRVKDLRIVYGKAVALHAISLFLDNGEIVAIVGANGAGKTTILKAISGLKKKDGGEIWYQDMRIDQLPAYKIVKMGIAHIPAGRRIFADMSVLDNILIGAYLRKNKEGIKQDISHIFEYFPVLKQKQNHPGGQLSGGEQQMLAIARALIARPKLLLMDEPSTGLSPLMVEELGNIIYNIKEQGISILLVEQNCRLALKLSNRAYILELGKLALEGSSIDLIDNDLVKECYLGG